MEEKIKKLKEIKGSISTMIYILEGNFSKEDLDATGTIGKEMECWVDECVALTEVYNSIIEEHGNEPCPHR